MSDATLPTYDMAVGGTGTLPERETATQSRPDTAVFRTSLRGIRALRFHAASRQALLELPVSGSFEAFSQALVAEVGKHLQTVAANAKGWRAGKLAAVNAVFVNEIRVDFEERGCCGGYGERVDACNWQKILGLLAQRGWRDELEVMIEVQ